MKELAEEMVEEVSGARRIKYRLYRRCSAELVSFREFMGVPVLTISCNSTKHSIEVARKTVSTGAVVMKGRYCFLLPGHEASAGTGWWPRDPKKETMLKVGVVTLPTPPQGGLCRPLVLPNAVHRSPI